MVLFRPVGEAEMQLIRESDFKAFPPRLPEQPIFYPVLNRKYAEEIAGTWNIAKNVGNRGYVLKFTVEDSYISQFEVHTVGRHYHEELWIPAEELENFNAHIIGKIEIVKVFERDEN